MLIAIKVIREDFRIDSISYRQASLINPTFSNCIEYEFTDAKKKIMEILTVELAILLPKDTENILYYDI